MALDTTTIAILASVAAIIISILVFSLFKGGKSTKRSAVLLAGLPNSGKTCFYYKIKEGKVKETYTSMKQNEGTFVPKLGDSVSKSIHFVDIPGHERVHGVIKQYLPNATCVIFFVDTVDFASNVNQTAEYLYDILTNPHVIKEKIPLLIACNKIDIGLYKKGYITKNLEKELEKIRLTRAKAVRSQDESERPAQLVEKEETPFSFATTARSPVKFTDCSVTKDEGIKELSDFIQEYAK